MRRSVWVVRLLVTGATVALSVVAFPSSAQAQTNSWASPSGGFWDDFRNWSLNIRPTNSHFVFVTNAPSKTVTIDSITSGSFPDSMTISNFALSASAGLTNTLSMASAGLAAPLSILDGLTIASGGSLIITNSALMVQGGLFALDGSVRLNSGWVAAGKDIQVGAAAVGTLTLAGGTLNLIPTNYTHSLYVGFGASSTGTIWVTGGQLETLSYWMPTPIYVGYNGSGTIILSNGSVQADYIYLGGLGGSHGTLTMAGGTLTATSIQGTNNGAIQFSAGAIHTAGSTFWNSVTVGDGVHAAMFDLTGGTNNFSGGLVISSNAVLTGCASISALYITNNGTILATCPGSTETISGLLVNNAMITATNGAFINFSGTIVNYGTIDGTLGGLFFGSGAINSGTILPTPPPASPSNLVASVFYPDVTHVYLTWTDTSDNETGFIVERSTNGFGFVQLATLPPDSTNYTDAAFGTNLTIFPIAYRVRAANSVGYSAYSNIATASLWTVTNSWINPNNGAWEDSANWSLAQAPAITHSILITNDNTKTVQINSITSGSFSNTMTVTDVILSAPNGVANTLALSDTGATMPLHVLNSLGITAGGVLLMTNSALVVDGLWGGAFSLDGSASLYATNSVLGDLYVGYSTNSSASVNLVDGQTLLTNGYTVIGFYGSGQAILSNGTLQVGNTNSLANGVFLGLTSGSAGSLTIAGGKYDTSEHLTLGDDNGSTGSVLVSDGQLIATNNYLMTIGNNGVGQLILSNGQLAASFVVVASGPASQGALMIAGGTGSFSRALSIGVGQGATGTVSITGGQLEVTNQNVIVGDYGVGQMTVSTGAFRARTVVVGNNRGSQGALTISGGITSVVSNLFVGQWGGTGLVAQVGGSLNVDRLAIACGDGSNLISGCCSTVVVSKAGVGQVTISNGVLFARTLQVGSGRGSQGTLTISGGITSIASNLVVGANSNATGVIQVTGGELNITNQSETGQLVVGQIGSGVFTQGGGTLIVDQLLAINGTNSVFDFGSGTFNTKSTTVSNTQTFVVGDGFGSATYHLLGGVHSFANDLRIRTNAFLTGCGTINGNVVVDTGGIVLTDCGGVLNFNGVFTNNGSVIALNGTAINFYGPVVNNGLINATNGSVHFFSTLENNGTILPPSAAGCFVTNIISSVSTNVGGPYYVGDACSNNYLEINSGGSLTNSDGIIGNALTANNNSALVTGPGSVWQNNGSLYVGNAGSANQMTILNGGAVFNSIGYLGFDGSSSNNIVTVSGMGSVWRNSGTLYVGNSGVGSQLIISNGGAVYSSRGYLGYNSSSSNNIVTVSGSGSVWSNSARLYVGNSGTNNQLIIVNGGAVYNTQLGLSPGIYIGNGVDGSSNTVVVSGPGSVLNGSPNFTLRIGNLGAGSQLIISNGGAVFSSSGYLGINSSSSNNIVTVSGPGSVWSNGNLYVGTSGAGNQLSIGAGGSVLASSTYVGFNPSSVGNYIIVTGGTLSNGTLDVRSGTLRLNDGTVTADALMSTYGASSVIEFNGGLLSSHDTTVTNGTMFTVGNGISAANFHLLGGVHSFNDGLRIANAATLSGCGTINGNVVVDTGGIVLADCGSTLSLSGVFTNNGSVIALNGTAINFYGPVVNNGLINANDGSVHFFSTFQNNGILLPGCFATNIISSFSANFGGPYYVGDACSNNYLEINSGGSLTNSDGIIGNALTANNNSALVVGPGSVWQNNGNLYIGNAGSTNQLAILNGGSVLASNAYVGFNPSSVGNQIIVSGGALYVTSTLGSGVLDVRSGTLTLNDGTVAADALIITNSASSVIKFNGGLLSSHDTAVTNGAMFTVGDGASAANFHLLGGVHSFNDGLRVRNNATLSGCGTINGSVVVDAGGTVLADCGGTLTFTEVITNNGVMMAVSGSTLESYGPVVNNGLINVLSGNTNFHAGFINNGLVLGADSIPQIVSIRTVGQDVEIRFTTSTGATYFLECRTNMASGSWIPLLRVVGSGGSMSVTDPGAALLPQKFYRVRLLVPE